MLRKREMQCIPHSNLLKCVCAVQVTAPVALHETIGHGLQRPAFQGKTSGQALQAKEKHQNDKSLQISPVHQSGAIAI